MTQTNIEQDKSDFEAWAVLNKYSTETFENESLNTFYTSPATIHAWKAWKAALKLQRERQASSEAVGYIKAERNALNTQDDNGNVVMVLRAHIDSSKVKDGDMIFTAPQQSNMPNGQPY